MDANDTNNANMIRKNKKTPSWISLGILLFGIVFSSGILVQAQMPEAPSEAEIEASGLAFPVAELGNCGNKTACKAYCNEPANMPACIAFAKAHGLMNEEKVSRAEKFSERLQAGKTPGGCNSPQSCEAYCSDIAHMDTCLAFAEEQGIRDSHIEEAKKIRAHLKAGGTMPGSCTSKASCEVYCGNFDHADECLAFAETVGIEIQNPDDEFGPKDIKEVRRVVNLMKQGETPGGCKSREACETYCRDQSHFEACIAFAEKAGFVDAKQAALARKTGGAGPGGCRSEGSCKTYCNDSAHQEECFKFAEEHGLVSQEDLKHAKEGFVRLRQGLEQAPPEVAECLKSKLGPNIIQDIQSGTLTPGPEIGDRIRGCFESFGHQSAPIQMFRDAPPKVLDCVREKIGADTFGKLKSGQEEFTPELGDTFRVCFQSMELERGFGGVGGAGSAPGVPGGISGGLKGFLESAPPEVTACLQNNLGDELQRIKAGEPPTDPALRQKIETCFREFSPQRPHTSSPDVPTGERPTIDVRTLPPRILECVNNTLGQGTIEKIYTGEASVDMVKMEQVVETCVREFGTMSTPTSQPAPIDAQPVSPPTTIEPVRSGGTLTPTAPAPFCTDVASCTRVCSDFANPYFNTPECEKMRSGVQAPTSQERNFLRLLGIILIPFLNLGR